MAAFDRRLAPGQHLHGIFRCDPRTGTSRPTGALMQPEGQSQPFRFLGRKRHILQPEIAGRNLRSRLNAAIDLKNNRATDPGAFHRLQVRRNPFAGHIAVHPMPPHFSLGRRRRLLKSCPHLVNRKIRRQGLYHRRGKAFRHIPGNGFRSRMVCPESRLQSARRQQNRYPFKHIFHTPDSFHP